MAYEKTLWVDKKTTVNAERLNKMEEGIYNSHEDITEIDKKIQKINKNEQATVKLINQISNERGYVNTNILNDGTDFNTVTTNGKFRIYQGLNAPLSGSHMFVIDVTVSGQNISQVAGLVNGERTLYHRNCVEGTWSAWARLVTNSEIESVNQNINQIISDATDLEERVSNNETEISNIKNNIVSVEQDITDIQNSIGIGEGSSGESLSDKITANKNEINSLKTRVETNENSISSLKQEEAGIKLRLDTLESKVTTSTDDLKQELQNNIDSVQTEFQNNIDRVEQETKQSFSDIDLEIEELKQKDSSIETDLQAHKTDLQAHEDIRIQIGDVNTLLTQTKEVVGAINELFMSNGSTREEKRAIVKGSEKVIRLVADKTTNIFDVNIPLDVNIIQIFLMGIRLFNEKDYSIEGSVITLKTTLLQGEYIDILSLEEIVIDLKNNTIAKVEKRYTAEKETSTFKIEGNLKYGELVLYQEGVHLCENFDYTVDKETNIVTLVQPLAIGEYVDYIIRGDTGTDITDIKDSIQEVLSMKDKVSLIPTVKTKVDEIEGKTTQLETSVNDIDTTLQAFEQEVETNKSGVEEVKQQINALKKIAYTTQESYFTQGETVLDFATKNSNSTKFVIAGITPSDLPISSEGWVSVESEIPSSARKRVVFKPYLQGRYEYYRELFNSEWRGEWKEIPSIDTVSRSKLLTTLEEVNNPNLESGIYSAEGEGVRMSFSTSVSSDYYVLIVNKHRLNPGYGTQLAIPYDNAAQRGIYYRICAAGTWGNWFPLAETKCADIILNGYSQGFITPRVLKIGNAYTISGDFNLPSAVPSGTVIGTIPAGFLPIANFHIFLDAYQIQLPFNARLWVTTDGNISLHGCDHLPTGATLEFNKTIIVP